MFGNFFIKVADVFLNIFDFFKNFNFKNLKLPKRNKTKKEIDPKLFTKLNFSEVKKQKDTQNKLFNKLRKIFLKYFSPTNCDLKIETPGVNSTNA